MRHVRAAVRDPGTRIRVAAGALTVHLIVSYGYGRRDGGGWIDDLNEQLEFTLPLTLLVAALTVAWSMTTAAGRSAPTTRRPETDCATDNLSDPWAGPPGCAAERSPG